MYLETSNAYGSKQGGKVIGDIITRFYSGSNEMASYWGILKHNFTVAVSVVANWGVLYHSFTVYEGYILFLLQSWWLLELVNNQ